MYPAVFSRTYPVADIDAVLAAITADGFSGTQLNLSTFGLASLPDQLDDAALTVLDHGRREAARLGVTVAALSGTYNMAHPDATDRSAARPRFRNVIRAATLLGAPIVTLCSGTRDRSDKWRKHPDNTGADAWADLRNELDWALEEAAGAGVVLAVEPEPGNVVFDARAARRLVDEVGNENLGVVLDAANLVGVDGLGRQQDIVTEAIDLLGPDIVLAHVKDIDATGRVVAPGRGEIDLPRFVAGLVGVGFEGALVAHGFDASETAGSGAAVARLCRLGESTAP